MISEQKRRIVSCILCYCDNFYNYERIMGDNSDIVLVFDLVDKIENKKSDFSRITRENVKFIEIMIDSKQKYQQQKTLIFKKIQNTIRELELDLEDCIIISRVNEFPSINQNLLEKKEYEPLSIAYLNFYWFSNCTDNTKSCGYPIFNYYNLFHEKRFLSFMRQENYRTQFDKTTTNLDGLCFYGLESVENFIEKINFGFFDEEFETDPSQLVYCFRNFLPPSSIDNYRIKSLEINNLHENFSEKNILEILTHKTISLSDVDREGFWKVVRTNRCSDHLTTINNTINVFVPEIELYSNANQEYFHNELKKIILYFNPSDRDHIILDFDNLKLEDLWINIKEKPLV